MPNAMSIQQAFNNALFSLSRAGVFESEEGEGKPAEKPITPYQQARLDQQAKKLDIEQQKADIKGAQEQRLQEDLLDKQRRTEGVVAQRKSNAAYQQALTEALKEKTAGQKLRRLKSKYDFERRKAADKMAEQSALDKYESSVAALNGQKTGMKQRKEMLSGKQIELEI